MESSSQISTTQFYIHRIIKSINIQETKVTVVEKNIIISESIFYSRDIHQCGLNVALWSHTAQQFSL